MPISPSSLNGYDFNSEAEKKIYVSALESRFFNNQERYLFHSLNVAKTGDKKTKGEIDYVYLDNECLLFFEVKGNQVKYDSLKNEWWVLGGTQKGNPFEQAYKSLFQVRDNLLPELFSSRSVSGRLIFGIGVLFPECIKPDEFRKSTIGQMEFDPALIYDYNDQINNGLINYINRVKKYWSLHPFYANRVGISQKEMATISMYFRRDLHFKLPVSDLLRKEADEVGRLTSVQMYVLDNLKFNPGKGGIISGGPGTGKTILALELLKRTLSESKRTLLVCYNKNLAEHLKNQTSKWTGDFKVCHLHSLYHDAEFSPNKTNQAIDTYDYWFKELPLRFVRHLNEDKKQHFDYIIIDEGQDILNEYHFDALGALLKGGIESGNWTIFMDKEYQNIYNADADDYFCYVRDVYPCFITLLYLNCRNTLSTIERASIQTGFLKMPCLRTNYVWKSAIKSYKSKTDLQNKINDLIISMLSEGIEKKHITILCFTKEQINDLTNSNKKLFVESAFSVPDKVNVSTIHAYKGLENEFILICGPENYDLHDKKQMSLIFIANTRALSQSIFFIDYRFEQLILNRLSE